MQTFLDIIITIIETILFFLLLTSKLELKPFWKHIPICFCIELFSVISMSFLNIPDNIRVCITLILHIAIACIISVSPIPQKIFWGSIYMVIVSISDALTFLFEEILKNHLIFKQACKIYISYTMNLVYLFICIFLVFIVIKHKKENLIFPRYLQFCFLIIIILSVALIECILDLISYFKKTDYFIIEQILFFSVIIFILSLILTIFLIYSIGVLYEKNIQLIKENQQKRFEKQQYDSINNTNQLLRNWKHDFNHHISVLQILSQKNEWDSVKSYLNQISKTLETAHLSVKTGNSIIDAILLNKLPQINKNEINFTYSIFVPHIISISNIELTALLGNLLDNAIEACENLKCHKYIKLEIKPYNNFFFLDIKNSSSGNYKFNLAKNLLSTKQEIGHGIGLKRIKQIVENSNGSYSIIPEKDFFQISLIIPLIKDTSKTKGEQ